VSRRFIWASRKAKTSSRRARLVSYCVQPDQVDAVVSPKSKLTRPIKKPKATWVEPQFYAAIEYRDITSEGLLRASSFKGLSRGRRQYRHKSVKLFHSQLLAKPGPALPVPTKQAKSARHHLSGQRQNPETRLVHDRSIHEHEGCIHAQIFSTGTIGIGFAVAALIAWSHAVTPLKATTASSSIKPIEMMATYKAPLPVEQWDAI
jgi:hypothetical protein